MSKIGNICHPTNVIPALLPHLLIQTSAHGPNHTGYHGSSVKFWKKVEVSSQPQSGISAVFLSSRSVADSSRFVALNA